MKIRKTIGTVAACMMLFILSTETFAQEVANENMSGDDSYQSFFTDLKIRGNVGMHAGGMNIGGEGLMAKTGGEVAVIFNDKLALGFVGNAFAGSQNAQINGKAYSSLGAYGGFLIEPILFPKKRLHLSIPVSIGGGSAEYVQDSLGYRDWDNISFYETQYADFIYFEPGVNLEINVTKFLRLGLSASYLMTSSVTNSSMLDTQLDGLNVAGRIKIGWFK